MDSKFEEFLRICYRVFITCDKKTVESRRQVHALPACFSLMFVYTYLRCACGATTLLYCFPSNYLSFRVKRSNVKFSGIDTLPLITSNDKSTKESNENVTLELVSYFLDYYRSTRCDSFVWLSSMCKSKHVKGNSTHFKDYRRQLA